MHSAFEKRMATALTECPLGTWKRKQIVAGQMLPAVAHRSSDYRIGAFNTLYHELTALEHSAFEKRMATALAECPLGTWERKQIVAGQMLPAVEVGSPSYTRGAFNTLYHELS
jgi:hypothetical protein